MTGVIILAAGSSSRLGEPKQNLVYKGKTLLQHALDAALASSCEPVILVTGAVEPGKLKYLQSTGIHITQNLQWQEGVASSIRVGLTELLTIEKDIESAIFMLCDQPFVDAPLLHKLIEKKVESGKGIISCNYKETLGVPVLFDRKYFKELQFMEGVVGAKKIIFKYKEDVFAVDFPKGAVDIDTVEDYILLMK
jgi:molybdenum cofactor cytidylyltransferase